MELTLTNVKRHIVAELLIIQLARERNVALPEGARDFWIYYWQELKSSDFQVEKLISEDPEMATFYGEWEEYDTYLAQDETRMSVITLAMKLVMAKALKYADNITLASMIASIDDKLKMSQA